MIFEDRINQLMKDDFYLHRACNRYGPKEFQVIIGHKTRLYMGEGDSLSEALDKAMSNYEKGERWPPGRKRVISYRELDDTMKDLGIELD